VRAGRNPTRRNRNTGTAKQGHGQDNRHRLPRAWADSRYAEGELARLREAGRLPFPRRLQPEAFSEEGLRLEDFTAPEP